MLSFISVCEVVGWVMDVHLSLGETPKSRKTNILTVAKACPIWNADLL